MSYQPKLAPSPPYAASQCKAQSVSGRLLHSEYDTARAVPQYSPAAAPDSASVAFVLVDNLALVQGVELVVFAQHLPAEIDKHLIHVG